MRYFAFHSCLCQCCVCYLSVFLPCHVCVSYVSYVSYFDVFFLCVVVLLLLCCECDLGCCVLCCGAICWRVVFV